MSVSATFEPSYVAAQAGVTALTLALYNNGDGEEIVRMTATGALAERTELGSETIYLGAGERLAVAVVVSIDGGMAAGDHVASVEVALADGTTLTADATLSVSELVAYEVVLMPTRSASSSAGKHRVQIDNRGNTPLSFDLSTQSLDSVSAVELSAAVVNVEAGTSTTVNVRVTPRSTYWSGAIEEHAFVIVAIGSDGIVHEMPGVYEQQPKTPSWLAPAAAGMLAALLIGTLAWFLLLKPAVRSIAEDEAEAANLAERQEFEQTLADLEDAAAEARRLPLGAPADLRLNATADPGGSASESFTVAADRVLSVTDVVFQNPGGAVGRVSLLRSGEVLLESDLANFRDLDFHFVAPFRFEGSDTVEITVECQTPGPSDTACVVGTTVIGFVASAD